MSGKHQTYFELRDALAQPGCVVCRLSSRSVRRYLEILSFESVNDYGIRAQLRQSRGFCNLHAWQLLDDVRDPFGAGIIYRDVLNHCAGLVEFGSVASLAPKRVCPACEAQAKAAARYLDVLGEHLGEADFALALERSGSLCWRHFALAVARGVRDLPHLANIQMTALRDLDSLRGPSSHQPRATVAASAPQVSNVRAGSAAPRRAPEEAIGDPMVGAAVGLPGGEGPVIEHLDARTWGHEPVVTNPTDPADEECMICSAAQRAVDHAIAEIPGTPLGPMELCPPHAWRAVDQLGPEPIRARLQPSVDHLVERIADSSAELARAAAFALGPLALSFPAARRARGDLALRLRPGRGCVVCAAQLAAEEDALAASAAGRLCRPHLIAAGRFQSPTLELWRAVVADLLEYIRKNDYRFRDEPRGAEQHSPWRAVALVAGARGIR